MGIRYDLLPENKQKTPPADEENLGFGQIRTNHMFLVDYKDGEWKDARIVPYGPVPMPPGAIVLHYGQSVFEGVKAFRHDDGEIYIFRYDENIKRLNKSAEIICMPTIPFDLHMEGVKRLIDVERDWCPSVPESSLYIRPVMFGVSDDLGAKPSKDYTFCIMLSPSGPYYKGGFNKTVSLLVTKKYHRAVSGGTGEAKTGGNYAASLRAAEAAKKAGCAQVLYLDAQNKYVEEVGSMNHYHVLKDGTFIIPKFTDTILTSITSSSVLELAQAGKVKARQERISLDDFIQGIKDGEIIEAGGLGTACVISPVGKYIFDDGSEVKLGDGSPGKFSKELFELYTGIQNGKEKAPEGWLTKIPHYKDR